MSRTINFHVKKNTVNFSKRKKKSTKSCDIENKMRQPVAECKFDQQTMCQMSSEHYCLHKQSPSSLSSSPRSTWFLPIFILFESIVPATDTTVGWHWPGIDRPGNNSSLSIVYHRLKRKSMYVCWVLWPPPAESGSFAGQHRRITAKCVVWNWFERWSPRSSVPVRQ